MALEILLKLQSIYADSIEHNVTRMFEARLHVSK